MSQRPVVVGLLLCESLIVEQGTHNVTLVNCFTRRKVERFPSEPQSFLVFATLTDGLGDVNLDLTIQSLADLERVYHRSRTFRFTDPLRLVHMRLRVTGCSFPISGAYEVSMSADGEPLGRTRFLVF